MQKIKGFIIFCRNFIESKFLVVTTLEQLNLFDIEENDEKKSDVTDDLKNEKVSPNNELKELGQHEEEESPPVAVEVTSLKEDERENPLPSIQKTHFQVMDKVKIVLISEDLDSETHNYRKYYEPHLIGKVGEITNVHVSSRGKVTYEVDVYGEKSIFEEAELLWIG